MHAAGGAESHKVQFLAGVADIVVNRLDLRVLHHRMVPAGHIDFHKVLIDHAAGAEVHVAHFGVAHLAVRQADVLAAGLEVAHGIFLSQRVDEWRALFVDYV